MLLNRMVGRHFFMHIEQISFQIMINNFARTTFYILLCITKYFKNNLMFHFHKRYLGLAFLILIAETLIALFVHDTIIRPYGGDFLVVILLYCLVKSVGNPELKSTVMVVLLFSYFIEILQYFHIVKVLGLEKSEIARIILGTSFSWTDMLAYTLGILFVVVVEMKWRGAVSI